MIKRYVDFELKISTKGEQIEIDIDGRPTAINLPEPIQVPLNNPLVDWKKINRCSAHDIAPLGHSLFNSIFIADINSKFGAYLGRRKDDEGVRLCINARSNDLAQAAWEILCSQLIPITSFLALNPRTPIIRCTRIGSEVYLRDIGIPLRLLVVLASPRLVEKIDPDEIRSTLEDALKDAIAQKQIEVTYLGFGDRTEANFNKLQEYLSRKEPPYDIVHIIAHGLLEEGLEGITALVQSEDGSEQDVFASNLANLFLSSRAMLVILQSCQSGSVDPSELVFSGTAQQLVASGVPAVLAMQGNIDQDVASCFINRLYSQWLNIGCPFEEALTQARQSVKQGYPGRIASWAIPVLYVCPGVQLSINKGVDVVEKNEQKMVRRQVEAALPQICRADKETELLVLIRAFDKRGLQEILSAQPRDYDAKPEDIRKSNEFQVSLPIDEKTQKILPADIKIVIETNDFKLKGLEKIVKIYPQGDSVLCIFLVTPKEEGPARAIVKVLDNNETILAELLLKTKVLKGKPFEAEYEVAGAELHEEPAGKLLIIRYPALEKDYSLKELVHVILPSEREQLNYTQQYIERLIKCLAKSEIETTIIGQFINLNDRLRGEIAIAEISEDDYSNINYEISIHFYELLYFLKKEIGEEKFDRIIKKIYAELEFISKKYPLIDFIYPFIPLFHFGFSTYTYWPTLSLRMCQHFCSINCNLVNKFFLLGDILNTFKFKLSEKPSRSYHNAFISIQDLINDYNECYIELEWQNNRPSKRLCEQYLELLFRFTDIVYICRLKEFN